MLAQTYFGNPDRFVRIMSGTGVDALGLDFVNDQIPDLTDVPIDTLIVAGLVDGHSVLRTDLDSALILIRVVS